MEVLWHGQTVGKRLLRIRVVKADGSPVTLVESALRNLLRLVDFFPACYPVGLITMLIDGGTGGWATWWRAPCWCARRPSISPATRAR